MKTLTTITLITLLTSCQKSDADLHFQRVVIIEGCQYFVCGADGVEVLSHKGNCKNLIHKSNQPLDKLNKRKNEN